MTATVIRGPWQQRRCPCEQCTDRPPAPSVPTPKYLYTRQELGMPSHADVLLRRCPWCLAGVGESCRVRATGQRTRQAHDARASAVLAEETA